MSFLFCYFSSLTCNIAPPFYNLPRSSVLRKGGQRQRQVSLLILIQLPVSCASLFITHNTSHTSGRDRPSFISQIHCSSYHLIASTGHLRIWDMSCPPCDVELKQLSQSCGRAASSEMFPVALRRTQAADSIVAPFSAVDGAQCNFYDEREEGCCPASDGTFC